MQALTHKSSAARLRPLQPVAAAPQAAVEERGAAGGKPKGKGKLTEAYGEPPVHIQRAKGQKGLRRGKLLGEGGFARVYEATLESDGSLKAIKVISKQQLQSTKNRTKLYAEIKLHQAMDHPRIVNFDGCFEDDENVYMVLQNCSGGSMLDILRKRKRFTEPEARFFLVQLVGACEYMHGRSVIHRDLKLGNLLLDDAMNLCVADFGLAALVRFPGERKKTICGTPNYIAPEILFDQDNGHSFEVDIWSVGVILYTLLVGKPPFQTKDVKVIYKKIKNLNYSFPDDVDISQEAMDLISQILHTDPRQRPQLEQILAHAFMHCGPFPDALPLYAIDDAPDFSKLTQAQSATNFAKVRARSKSHPTPETPARPAQSVSVEAAEAAQTRVDREARNVIAPQSPIADLLRSARKPLQVSPNNGDLRRKVLDREAGLVRSGSGLSTSGGSPARPKSGMTRSSSTLSKIAIHEDAPAAALDAPKPLRDVAKLPSRELYESVLDALETALAARTTSDFAALAQHLPAAPRVFITSWVDYTQKYGTAYALTDGTVGFYFNDSSTMCLAPNKQEVDYISSKERSKTYIREHFHLNGPDAVPEKYDRKLYLLQYFDTYMAGTLERDNDWCQRDAARTTNLDFMIRFYRMEKAIIFKLSNGVLQFNFFDHTKILLTEGGHGVTIIGPDGKLRTYSLAKLVRERATLETTAGTDPLKLKKLSKARSNVDKLKYAVGVLRELGLDSHRA